MSRSISALDHQSSMFAARLLLAFLIPLVISLLGITALLRWAPVLGLVDVPNDRKIHARPIPTGGGLAIFAAWAVTVGLPWFRFESLGVVGGAGLVIVVLGLADDLRPLPWQFRLGIQTATAVATLAVLSARYSSPITHCYFLLLALFWIVGVVNAFNMLDNMDALSAGVAWIAAGFLVAALVWIAPDDLAGKDLEMATGPKMEQTVTTSPPHDLTTPLSHHATHPAFRIQHSALYPLFALMGALTGFLWYNRPPARIFMGDAGSTFLGFLLAVASLQGGIIDRHLPRTWAVPLCVLAIPWYDMTSVVFIRWRQGKSPFYADKQHLSHRLVNRGLSPAAAVGVIYLLALAIGVGGLLVYHVAGSLFVILYLIGCWAGLGLFEYWTRAKRETRMET
jgi:UDP-GlcNAc:undecaprenyl-phosphate GlcNAc-1-phosphate transferase